MRQFPVEYALHPGRSSNEFRHAGEGLLRSGRVAIVMAAGGISTRMQGSAFRGLIPVGPVTGRSLFRLQAEKIAALRRKYDTDICWIVATSEGVHEETLAAFRGEGLEDEASFIQQDSLPALPDGAESSSAAGDMRVPTGHGGIFTVLARSGKLDRLAAQGVTEMFFFQYPNVLEVVCDPVFLGYHHSRAHEVTLKAFRSRRVSEKVGRVCELDGKLAVVEYYFGDSSLDRFPANMNSFVFSLSFLRQCSDDGVQLPWHRVPLHLPNTPPLWRREQFIFDLLRYSRRSAVLLVHRGKEYAVIKQPTGIDSPATARAALLAVYKEWLKEAGAKPSIRSARVEISPFFALDALDVTKRVEPGLVYEDQSIFEA